MKDWWYNEMWLVVEAQLISIVSYIDGLLVAKSSPSSCMRKTRPRVKKTVTFRLPKDRTDGLYASSKRKRASLK